MLSFRGGLVVPMPTLPAKLAPLSVEMMGPSTTRAALPPPGEHRQRLLLPLRRIVALLSYVVPSMVGLGAQL